ncbi:MAG: hypothetical protein PHD81_04375 [Candidatus Nanoarchaeia archaeon]|nr:hypothetical protein [Candidatus Nanoarchaeia archaeon]MDD5588314.1 hypothetical protein [Candidatus Nanoarchaeia archaeon]
MSSVNEQSTAERVAEEIAKREAIEDNLTFNREFTKERKFKHLDLMVIKHVSPQFYFKAWEQADKLAKQDYNKKGDVFVLIEGSNRVAFIKSRREFHLKTLLGSTRK